MKDHFCTDKTNIYVNVTVNVPLHTPALVALSRFVRYNTPAVWLNLTPLLSTVLPASLIAAFVGLLVIPAIVMFASGKPSLKAPDTVDVNVPLVYLNCVPPVNYCFTVCCRRSETYVNILSSALHQTNTIIQI